MISPSWITVAERLCRRIAGEDLANTPIYILDGDSLDGWGDPYSAAYTSGNLDLALEDHLRARGQWRGRGLAMLVFPSKCVPPDATPATAVVLVVNATLHELGHGLHAISVRKLVTRMCGTDYRKLPDRDELSAEQLATATREYLVAQPARRAGDKPWNMHGDYFIRAACHVAHRAQRVGHYASATTLHCGGEYYGLSPASLYAVALGDEPHRRQDEPISDILLTQAPPAFTALFASDTQGYEDRMIRTEARQPEVRQPDSPECVMCRGLRKRAGRPNRTSIYHRDFAGIYLRCDNCLHSWILKKRAA